MIEKNNNYRLKIVFSVYEAGGQPVMQFE